MLASDLHVHLDGSLRPDTLVDLGARAGLWDREAGPDRIRDLRFREGMSLTSCLARFETTVGLLSTTAALTRVARELVRDCYLDGVRHAEIRLCPPLHTRRGLAVEDVLEAVLGGAEEGARACGPGEAGDAMSARLVLSVLEGMGEEEAGGIVDLAARFQDQGVVGVDLAGDESLFDPEAYRRPLATARDRGLGLTVHAGEGTPPSHVRAAVEVLGADRVGHGTSAASDGRVLDLLAARGVTVEVCLTSNTQTGAVLRLEDHPLPRMLDAGVRVALATDNRFFSETTLSREYDLAADRLSVGREGIERMVIEGARAAFLPDGERRRLLDLYRASLGGRTGDGAPPDERSGETDGMNATD
jgi:adenosine deaminase